MTATKSASAKISHVYYEVAGDLLAKPTALTQLIEGSAVPATIVFCNSPSDTDLVEVLLKKRGVSAQKLIGNVPASKVEQTLAQLQSGELSTVVVTDASAKSLDVTAFDLLISYTAPGDMETYVARFSNTPAEGSESAGKLKKVATLVSPSDLNNFQFVQQSLDTNIEKADLPTAEDLQKAKVTRIKNIAVAKCAGSEDKYKTLADAILADKEKTVIISYLLQNTLEVIPSLQAASYRDEDHYDDDDHVQPRFNGHSSDRDGGRGGNDRRRGNDRGGNRNNNNRGGNGQRRPYADLDDDSEASMQAKEAQARNKRRPNLPPLKEARIYVGQGSQSGLDEAGIKKMVQTNGALSESDVRRVVVRKNYAFFDVLEEQAAGLLEKLDDSKIPVKKATVISTQRQESRDDDMLDTAPTLEEIQAAATVE